MYRLLLQVYLNIPWSSVSVVFLKTAHYEQVVHFILNIPLIHTYIKYENTKF